MKKDTKSLMEKYLKLLRLKKFMVVFVIPFTFMWGSFTYFLIQTIIDGAFVFSDIIVYLGYNLLFYMALRLFQQFWINAGAEDRYDYFTNRDNKKK